MPRYGAFLRAVNVGGTGKLPMADLRKICADCGFEDVKTYIASGNVVLNSSLSQHDVEAKLEAALLVYSGKTADVFVRTSTELEHILAATPFPDAMGNRVTAILLKTDAQTALDLGTKGHADEECVAGDRVIYVYYPSGMGKSKLRLLGGEAGTARNMNTIAKMAALTA